MLDFKSLQAILAHRKMMLGTHVEKARQDHEGCFRTLIEGSMQGIAIHRDDKILFANPGFAHMFGYETVDDILPVDSIWSLIVLSDRNRLMVDQQAGPVSATTVLHDICQGITKQGAVIWLDISMSDVNWEGESAVQWSVTDISEHHRVKEALHCTQRRLWNLAKHLQERQENERRYIARELHDELGQGLTGLKLEVAWLANHVDAVPTTQHEGLSTMDTQIDQLITAVRRIGSALRPEVLDDLGLVAAIEWQLQALQKRTDLTCTFAVSPETLDLEPGCATVLFRILQEALTNVVRHAAAKAVSVRLIQEPDSLYLEVRDDGKGISPEQLQDPTSLGLLIMQERAQLWGGEVQIRGKPGVGTTVVARIQSTSPSL